MSNTDRKFVLNPEQRLGYKRFGIYDINSIV